MGFIIEKLVSETIIHPSFSGQTWLKKDDKLSIESAKEKLKILKEKEDGTYRIRDIYSGKIWNE
jgi:Asp-tRNA(Asn)/Glu-tRNA(Gln) amidotransferase C subunit